VSHSDEPHDDASQRYKRVDLQRKVSLKFKEFQGFITEYSENISAGGMFIRTKDPQAPGSMFDFEFTLGEDYTLIHGLGEVVWVRDEDEGFDRPAGMGVRFLSLDEKSRELIDRMVAERLEAQKARVAEPITSDPHWGMAGATEPGPASSPEQGSAQPAAAAPEDETVAEGVPPWLPSPPPPVTSPERESSARPSLFDMLPDPEKERPVPVAEPDETVGGPGEVDEPRRQMGPSPYARSYPVASAQVAVRSSPSRRPWMVVGLLGLVVAAVVVGAVVFFPESVPGWLPWGADDGAREAAAGTEVAAGAEMAAGAVTGSADQGADDADGAAAAGDLAPGSARPAGPGAAGAESGETVGVMDMVEEEAGEDRRPAGAGDVAPGAEPPGRQAASPAQPSPEPRRGPTSDASPGPSAGRPAPVPPAPEEEPFTRVLNITWEQLEGELLVTIYLDGAVREWDYSHVRVGSPPPRELVIVRGIREPFARTNIPVAAAMVDQIRVGFHPKRGGNELHVVLDVARPTVYLERMEASGREIRLYLTVRER